MSSQRSKLTVAYRGATYHGWQTKGMPRTYTGSAAAEWLGTPTMQRTLSRLVGQHDFASFAKPGDGKATTGRTVLDCSIARRGALIVVGVEGAGFLWNMVRIMVGTLVEVGLGRTQSSAIDQMLEAKDRTAA